MRIVHTEASCGWGGQEIRVLEESVGLAGRGHDVTILCEAEAPLHAEARKRGVAVEALPIGRKNVRGLMAMIRWLRGHPVDVINTHSSTDTWLAALACSLLGRSSPPIVRTRHISAPVPANWTTTWLYTKATRHIVTTGEALRRQLVSDNAFPGRMITSVPTGIDSQCFAPGDRNATRSRLGLDADFHYLGIVATLRSWKGHLHLLDAFSRFAMPRWKLLIVGDGPMRDPILARIAELGLGDRVQMAGQQKNPEEWLRAMDIFCLPSYANEGVPQAVVQAMLTALPIISTPIGAIPEAVTDGITGVLVSPRDPAALAAAIERLASDTGFASRLGTAARLKAEKSFSYEAMLDSMETIFAEVLS